MPKAQNLEKKAKAQADKDAKAAMDAERAEAAAWDVGSNAKGASRQREAEEKAAAKAAKKAESERLLAADTAGVTVAAKKTKKKGKDDFDKLNAALAAIPKTKAQKEAEAAAKRKEETQRQEAERKAQRDKEKAGQEEIRRKAAAKGIVMDHGDEYMVENVNHRVDEFVSATGLEGALEVLAVGSAEVDKHPERRQKAAYNAYFEKTLPVMQADHPGLKLSQYKERIFEEWKTSPENPRNATSA